MLNWITMDGSRLDEFYSHIFTSLCNGKGVVGLEWWSRNEGNARNEQIELLWDFFTRTWSCFYCHFHSSMLTSILHKWIYEFYIAVYYTTAEKKQQQEEERSSECRIVMALNMLWIIMRRMKSASRPIIYFIKPAYFMFWLHCSKKITTSQWFPNVW